MSKYNDAAQVLVGLCGGLLLMFGTAGAASYANRLTDSAAWLLCSSVVGAIGLGCLWWSVRN